MARERPRLQNCYKITQQWIERVTLRSHCCSSAPRTSPTMTGTSCTSGPNKAAMNG